MSQRVIFVEEPRSGFNLDSATRLGEMVVLLKNGVDRPSVFKVRDFVRAVLDELTRIGYDPRADILVNCGALAPVTVATAAMVERYGALRTLLFHAPSGEYVECKIGESHGGARRGEPVRLREADAHHGVQDDGGH